MNGNHHQEQVKDFAAGGDSSLARLSPSYYPDLLVPKLALKSARVKKITHRFRAHS